MHGLVAVDIIVYLAPQNHGYTILSQSHDFCPLLRKLDILDITLSPIQYSTELYSIAQDSAVQYIRAFVQCSAIVQCPYHSKGGGVTTTSSRSAGILLNCG